MNLKSLICLKCLITFITYEKSEMDIWMILYFCINFISSATSQQYQNFSNIQDVFIQNIFDKDIDSGSYLKNEAKAISSHLRKIANEELGVTSMQSIYDSLPFVDVTRNTEKQIEEMHERLRLKIENSLGILEKNEIVIENLYRHHLNIPLPNYFPCCDMDARGLVYDEHFGIEISRDISCDLLPLSISSNLFSPGFNLSEVFRQNLEEYSTIKWQYFISTDGIHSEYPAYISDTICKQTDNSRHKNIYLGTVQPFTKYIVIVIDHGNSLSPLQLKTAKAIGKHILSSLSHKDKVTVVGIAGDVKYPYDNCMSRKMASATQEIKFYFSRFIDNLQKTPDATNHILGFSKAFELMQHTLPKDTNGNIKDVDALIVYISRGLLSSLTEARSVFEIIAKENRKIRNQVIINTYVVIDDGKPVLYEKAFLQDIANQNYKNYDIHLSDMKEIKQGKMIAVNTTENLSLTIGDFTSVFSVTSNSTTVFSLPHWDTVGKGIVISISKPVFHKKKLIGIVGLDISVADLAEDITYFTQSSRQYAFLLDESGIAVMHPYFTRPTFASEQPMHTDISHLENRIGFHRIRQAILSKPEGEEKLLTEQNFIKSSFGAKQNFPKFAVVSYKWKKISGTPYIICIVTIKTDKEEKKLKSISVPKEPTFVYHRLDLLPPHTLCRHMKQLSTLEASTLFLSAGAFQAPFEYLTQEETKQIAQSYMAYLNDNIKLIANPGLKSEVRNEVLAIGRITTEWIKRMQKSDISKYIVRRYIATPSGIYQTYPGSLVDKTYDPTRRDWFIRALEYPGRVVLTAPYLDIGGAGYVVTLSHTIFEGKPAAMHSSTDFVEAVMGMDFTLGYLYKILVDIMPMCEQDKITCFILDDKGYLIAHPDLIEPTGRGPVEQQHITHKEPLVANDILNHRDFVQKKVCNNFNDRTIQRYYQFNTSLEGVLTNLVHGEQCAKYQISAIQGTNVFLGIVNQSCDPITAFCPCSMIDRLCLNCHRMEQTECECPCECPLMTNLCTGQLEEDENIYPSCSHFPEEPHLPVVDMSILDSLDMCFENHCYARKTESECFGVLGCEWCQLDSDGLTLLKKKFCTEHRKCFGGILGARTPYADEIIGLPSEEFFTIKSTPVGPVAGGIMGCFLILALAVYCYRHHVSRTSSVHFISSTPGTTIRMSQLDNEPEDAEHREEPINPIGRSSVALASFENAALSPYRISTYYRRPPGGDSDNGYGTMTTHEESEHMPCVEPLIGRDRPKIFASQQSTSSCSTSSSASRPFSNTGLIPFSNSVTLAPWMVNHLITRDPSQTVIYTEVPQYGCHVLTQAQVHAMETH